MRRLNGKAEELGRVRFVDHPVSDADHPVDPGDRAQRRLELVLLIERPCQLDNTSGDKGTEGRPS